MKKFLFLGFMLLLAICLFGQSPRLIGMGNVDGYIDDDSDIFTYPASINMYGNTLYGYLSSYGEGYNTYNFGFNYELAKAILGVYLNKPLPYDAMNSSIMFENEVELDHNFSMLMGFNENMALSFSLAMDSYVNDDAEDTEKATAFGFGFGYKNDVMDLGINMLIPSYSQELAGEEEAVESKFLLDADGRGVIMSKEDSDLVGKVHFGLGSSTYDSGVTGADEEKMGYLDINFGVAKVINLNKNNLVVLGMTPFGFYSSTYEYGDMESSTTYLTLPAFNIGFESQVCKWLVLRSGFEQVYYSMTSTYEEGNYESESSSYDNYFVYNMGLGIMFNNFCIDYVFNKDFLHNGPNFITGATTNNLFGKIMVEYKFGKK